MIVPFEKMPSDSRIWIYQAERPITEQERELIMERTKDFVKNWSAHGVALTGSYCIRHDQFLIIAVDESVHLPSGCSIDASVSLVRLLENELRISFLDRSRVAIKSEDKIYLKAFNELKESVHSGSIKENDLVFDNTIQRMDELDSRWIVPVQTSWLSRYF